MTLQTYMRIFRISKWCATLKLETLHIPVLPTSRDCHQYFIPLSLCLHNARTTLSQCPNKCLMCLLMSKWHKQILSYINNNNMATRQNTNINVLTFSFSVQWVLYRNSTTISFTDKLLLIKLLVPPMVSTFILIPTTTNTWVYVCLVYFNSFSSLVDNVNSVMSSSSFISPSLLISSLSYDNPVSMATSGPPVLIVSLSSVAATLILIMILTLMLVGLYVTKRRRVIHIMYCNYHYYYYYS